MSQINVRKYYPTAILIIFGVFSLLSYYIDIPVVENVASTSRTWVVIISAFMVLLGALNVFRTHVQRTISKRENWLLSGWLIFVFSIMIVIGLLQGTGSPNYKSIYNALYVPLAQSIVGTLGLFLVSAAYRAFKIRSLEGLIFFIGAFLIAIRQASVGPLLWPGFETIGNWVTLWPSIGTMRGVTIGLAIGTVAISLRTLLTWENVGLEEEGAGIGGG